MGKIVDKDKLTLKYRSSYATDIIIQQLDQRDVPTYTCTLKNAYPITVSAYDLSNSSENTTQKLSVTFAYEDWAEEGFVESILSKGKVLLGSVGRTLGL
jgi:predicted nucleic acid-binding protein